MKTVCPQCGVEDWVDGRAELGGKGGLQFRPEKSKFMVLSWPAMTTRVYKARGYVQLSVEPEKLKGVLKD
ncbi:MAG: hypothetical protein ACRD5I_01705 [Candidatus Acidiferrales bacterium]